MALRSRSGKDIGVVSPSNNIGIGWVGVGVFPGVIAMVTRGLSKVSPGPSKIEFSV